MEMKNTLGQIEGRIENMIRYEAFILVGVLMTIFSAMKVIWGYTFSSDWLWLLAGVGLTVEGLISWSKQKRFDKKYKVIEREN
ncbi:MAG: hypothetical protein WC781_02535 [Candidatus Pacearchaeota archaeon]|jgi:hypothetical protein